MRFYVNFMSTFDTFDLKLSRSDDSTKKIRGASEDQDGKNFNETFATRKHWRNSKDASKLGIHLDGSSDSLAPKVQRSGAKQRNPTGPKGTTKSINNY